MLKLANGDRDLAMKNLENDSLATHPEVVAFLEAHAGDEELELREVPVAEVCYSCCSSMMMMMAYNLDTASKLWP